jgi:hypothetical protein
MEDNKVEYNSSGDSFNIPFQTKLLQPFQDEIKQLFLRSTDSNKLVNSIRAIIGNTAIYTISFPYYAQLTSRVNLYIY